MSNQEDRNQELSSVPPALKVYPWCDEPGLCLALCDPLIWAKVFDEKMMRWNIKKLYKHALRSPRRLRTVNIEKDNSIGEAILSIWIIPELRMVLKEIFSSPDSPWHGKDFFREVRNKMLQHLIWTHNDRPLPYSKDAFIIHDDGDIEISEAFEAWLSEISEENDDYEIAAYYTAAIAIGDSDNALSYAQALLQVDPLFTHWLAVPNYQDEETPSSENEASEETSKEALDAPDPTWQTSEKKASGAPKEEKTTEITSTANINNNLPPETKEVIRMLQVSSDMIQTFTKNELQARINLLNSEAGRYEAILKELNTKRQKAISTIDGISLHKLVSDLIQSKPLLKSNDENSVKDELARYEKLIDSGLELKNTLERIDTLNERIGIELNVKTQTLKTKSFNEICTYYNGLIADLEAQANAIAKREKNVSELFRLIEVFPPQQADTCIGQVETETWESLYHFALSNGIQRNTTDEYLKWKKNDTLAGLVLTHLWRMKKEVALRLVPEISTYVPLTELERCSVLFSHMSFSQLQQLCSSSEELASTICSLIFCSSFTSNPNFPISFLETIIHQVDLDPVQYALYNTLIIEYHRNNYRKQELISLLLGHKIDDQKSLIQEQHEKVLTLIDTSPGMTGNYHFLRVLAKHQFIEPLSKDINKLNLPTVINKWREAGSIEDKVNECIAISGKSSSLRHSHIQQTKKYLENFEHELVSLNSLLGKESKSEEMNEASKYFRHAAIENNNILFKNTIELIENLTNGKSSFPLDFGRRCDNDGYINYIAINEDLLIKPSMLASWPKAIDQGKVPVGLYLYDYLREKSNISSLSEMESINYYLSNEDYFSAEAIADKNEKLKPHFLDHISTRKKDLLDSYSELIAEAELAKGNDEYIDLALDCFNDSINTYDFSNAVNHLKELSSLIQEYNLEQDPERKRLQSILEDAGVTISKHWSIDDLNSRIQALYDENISKRHHIIAMQELSQSEALPKTLCQRFETVARRMDLPSYWNLADQDSKTIGESLKHICHALSKKLTYHTYQSGRDTLLDIIIDSLCEWLPKHLTSILNQENKGYKSTIQMLSELGIAMQDGCPDQYILSIIGSSPTPKIEKMPSGGSGTETLTVKPNAKEEVTPPSHTNELVYKTIEDVFLGYYHNVKIDDSGNIIKDIYELVENRSWDDVLKLSAAEYSKLSQAASNSIEECQLYFVIAKAVLNTRSSTQNDLELINVGCLSILITLAQIDSFDPVRDTLTETLIELFCNCHQNKNIEKTKEPQQVRLIEVIKQLSNSASQSDFYECCANLMLSCSGFTCKNEVNLLDLFVDCIWQGFTGASDSGRARADLLYLLYRLKLVTAIEILAGKYSSNLKIAIASCVNAHQKAEANPEAAEEANHFSDIIEEQSANVKNVRPWVLFSRKLRRSPKEGASIIPCQVELRHGVRDGKQHVILHIHVQPSRYDFPDTLSLEFEPESCSVVSNDPIILTDEKTLHREHIIQKRLKLKDEIRDTDLIYLPYIINGSSITGKKIELKGHWTIHPEQQYTYFWSQQVSNWWPGASGRSVKSNAGFFGREREKTRIEQMIEGTKGKQTSAVIYGPRRIGKTSLIIEMQQLYAPQNSSRVAGVFADIAGINYDSTGNLRQMIFDHIIDNILYDSTDYNGRIVDAMQINNAEKKRFRRQIRRDFEPTRDLSTALSGLCDMLRDKTNIPNLRMAIFLDEFQAVYRRSKEEVNGLMWDLRQLVLHSPVISLFFAGSGLTKGLIEHYDEALFGSIDSIELKPFSWQSDRNAIIDLLLPNEIRSIWCPSGKEVAEIASQVNQLCGGHPYYLSMLAYTLATLYGNTPLSIPMVNEAMEHMVLNRIDTTGKPIEASTFYGHLLNDLEGICEKRQFAVARLLLTNIAKQVSIQWPNCTVVKAIEIPGLSQNEVSERDRLSVLRMLDKEGIITIDASKGLPVCQFVVPVVSMAIKQNSSSIEHEALWELKGD